MAGYAAAGLALAATGWALAVWLGMPALEAGAGALGACAVQTAAFRPLWARIRSGERALRVWVAGMVARVAGLGGVAGGAALSGLQVAPAAIVYGLTVIVLLWAEAWWLHRASRAGGDEGSGEDGATAASDG